MSHLIHFMNGLPPLNPNFVLWCNLISDVITSLASSIGCVAVLRLLWLRAKDLAKKL